MLLHMNKGLSPLGQEIERLLDERGWNKSELGRRSGRDSSTVGRLMAGETSPTAETLLALAAALGVDGTYLLRLAGLSIPEGVYHPEAAYIARQLTELPPDLQEQAIDAVGGVVDSFVRVADAREGRRGGGNLREMQQVARTQDARIDQEDKEG
jgi:transcriptional regulator with XRE-family HTH domain